MHSLHHDVEPRQAEALASLLDSTGNLVTSVVPSGYEYYLRVLNPIELGHESMVSWSEAVVANGLEPSPWMQWDELVAASGAVLPDGDGQPQMGNPHPRLASALIKALVLDDSIHYFASWAGYWSEFTEPVVMFSPYQREMVQYSGRLLDELGAPIVPTSAAGYVPMYWWPSDLSWCVGQDIYARSIIVGCDKERALSIFASPDLDAYRVRDSDTVLVEDF